eukprot:CAMPEP_0119510086 /NCGR_PEP_ID=MMETSP1344-20130328/29173_1 /TAXON_ID=236787 /ORGANISM="Florenciella parvula, Strain CCMP2471" /LENGTH=34 /DNA_ID= /DNA_START= /DNA_END= /DNA_ORIENTATION=
MAICAATAVTEVVAFQGGAPVAGVAYAWRRPTAT